MKIFINPGHCVGSDSGAVGYGLTEAEVALNIAERVSKYLAAVAYDTKLFQYDGLAEIVDVANYWDADIFVSIHCNACDGSAQGTDTCIQNKIVSNLGTVDRGVKSANFFVLRYTKCPAVLVETAFIDNYHDNTLLYDYEDEFARAIACKDS